MRSSLSRLSIVSVCVMLIGSCCQSFWVSRGRIAAKSGDLSATVYLIDSKCAWRSGYLLRVENDARVFAEKFIAFEETGKDYEADIERVVLDSLGRDTLAYHYMDKNKARIRGFLSW